MDSRIQEKVQLHLLKQPCFFEIKLCKVKFPLIFYILLISAWLFFCRLIHRYHVLKDGYCVLSICLIRYPFLSKPWNILVVIKICSVLEQNRNLVTYNLHSTRAVTVINFSWIPVACWEAMRSGRKSGKIDKWIKKEKPREFRKTEKHPGLKVRTEVQTE